ncbi:MAG TPA: hypothetical protein VEB70_01140 [Noviherbaspirillum sp.]|nr:hypothetical protein [Noviherbaspirillum sp.]
MSFLSMTAPAPPKSKMAAGYSLCGHWNLSNMRVLIGKPSWPPAATKLSGNNALVHASKQKENMGITKLLFDSLKHIFVPAAKAAHFLQLQPLLNIHCHNEKHSRRPDL